MTYRQKVASLFIIVFFGVILMKPVHFLLVDHDTHQVAHTHAGEKSTSLHQDCGICLFMLQAFTPQKFAELQLYFAISYSELINSETQVWAYQFIPQNSLRGPPFNSTL